MVNNFIKIFSGVLLTGIGVAIIANPVNNIFEWILGFIFIAAGMGVLLKD